MDELYSPQSSTARSGPHFTLLDLESTPPAASKELTRRVASEVRPTGGQRLAWLLSMFTFLLLLSFFLPLTVEKMSYAVARGKERAKYEAAGEQLNHLGLNDLSRAYQLVANRVSPSVVHINVVASKPRGTAKLMAFPSNHPPRSDQGSGVIVDQEGYILTNHHVVASAEQIRVKLSDGRRLSARVVGADPLTDLAVLKISASDLIAVEWGESDDLEVGALVWALGSPFGLESSVTFGILSAKHRSEKAGSYFQDFLQTDAAVNPGNSGGPLVDTRGRVVGINTAIVGDSYQGIGFAIPSSVAKPVYERIKNSGRVQRGWLGVRPAEVTEAHVRDYALPDTAGALVLTVEPGSPAAQAGIRPHDVIVQWDGHPIHKWTDLFTRVAATQVGTEVSVQIRRASDLRDVQVVVSERPPEGAM